MQRALTDALVRSVQVPQQGRIEITDTRSPGLTFRVTSCGVRSWSLRFRDPQSRLLCRATLGRYPDLSLAAARERADEMRQTVTKGGNPVAIKRQQAREARSNTFRHLAQRYVEEHSRRFKRSHHNDERNLRLHVLPAWESRRYDKIQRADVIELLEGIVKQGKPALANSVHVLLSSLFSFAVDGSLLGSHPCSRLRKRGIERVGRRVLSDDEIRLFWAQIVNPPVSRRAGLALRFALLTGARSGEITGMRQQELVHLNEPAKAAWVLPADRSKNGKPHLVPLTARRLAMLFPSFGVALKAASSFHRRAKASRLRVTRLQLQCADLLSGFKAPKLPTRAGAPIRQAHTTCAALSKPGWQRCAYPRKYATAF